jgi:glycosyltransferase involved in cell wall biosynthesis
LLVGTIGRIHPRKDLETFLRAAAIASGSLPSAKFAVVGSAEAPEEIAYERTVRAVAGELDIAERVRFTGARVDVPRVLKALDVFVLTSRHEGFGRVVAEAMAAGTPVIVTNEGAPRELVQDGHDGFHAEPASPSSFAKALTRIADDPDLRRHAASNAQRSAVKFAARSVAGRVLDAYRNADRVAGEGA